MSDVGDPVQPALRGPALKCLLGELTQSIRQVIHSEAAEFVMIEGVARREQQDTARKVEIRKLVTMETRMRKLVMLEWTASVDALTREANTLQTEQQLWRRLEERRRKRRVAEELRHNNAVAASPASSSVRPLNYTQLDHVRDQEASSWRRQRHAEQRDVSPSTTSHHSTASIGDSPAAASTCGTNSASSSYDIMQRYVSLLVPNSSSQRDTVADLRRRLGGGAALFSGEKESYVGEYKPKAVSEIRPASLSVGDSLYSIPKRMWCRVVEVPDGCGGSIARVKFTNNSTEWVDKEELLKQPV